MRTYLRAQSLMEVMGNESIPTSLLDNQTIVQVRFHTNEAAKEGRALSIIQGEVHNDIFIRILNLNTTKEDWEKLKEEFQCNERTRRSSNTMK
uniref:Retrovirus-related Pol polyprotein from transposon TNT 1-94 n=1 Tax=Cajanus cajan TaxID=3821 RepID=A0A151TYU4_CAJCA|nr:hypothetical protein KK1_004738 [Cajanus cajan]